MIKCDQELQPGMLIIYNPMNHVYATKTRQTIKKTTSKTSTVGIIYAVTALYVKVLWTNRSAESTYHTYDKIPNLSIFDHPCYYTIG